MEIDEKTKIKIEADVKVPVETAWKLWNTPEDITKWASASDDWHSPRAENDLRNGGEFVTRMEAKDGSVGFDFSGVYDEVTPHEHIAYTLDDGRKVDITFRETGEETHITQIFEAESENPVEMQQNGWQAILNNFKKYAGNHSNMKNRTIKVTREFDAPVALVFEAFSQPEHIGKWWGPKGFSTTTKSMDFKVSGDWIFTMHGPDGTDYANHIIYTEIIKPQLIKYDHYGHRDEESDPPHFKSTITFENVDGKTKVEMNMLFPTVEKRNEAVEFGALEGGLQTLARLADFLHKNHKQIT